MSDHLYSNMHIIQRESLLPLFANQVVALEVASWQMRRQKFISLIGAALPCYQGSSCHCLWDIVYDMPLVVSFDQSCFPSIIYLIYNNS